VIEHPGEPAILDRIVLETASGDEWLPHLATIANLTPEEVWVGLEDRLGGLFEVGGVVRLTLDQPSDDELAAVTTVLRHVGADGRVIVLARPESWDFPSRRANSRAKLAIPAYLHPADDAPTVSARTTNLGVGGFHCLSDIPIAVGNRLPVSLQLTPVSQFDCQAQVVRLEDDPEDPSGRLMVVAFRFLDLSEDDEATIAGAILALAGDVDAEAAPKAWHAAGS
jgi:hypothetical protein